MNIRTFTKFKMRISEEDLRKLEEHVKNNPDNIDYLDWAAFAFYSNGLFGKAIQAYRRLITYRPDNASYHYYLANSLFKNGELDPARLEWEKVIRIDTRGQFAVRSRRKLNQIEQTIDEV